MDFSNFDSALQSCYEDNFRIGVDRFCDFIPFASTVTNLIDLFQKHASSAAEKSEANLEDSYWSYISNKDNLRCILLAIPIFNIPVAIYYYFYSPIVGTSSSDDDLTMEESTLAPAPVEQYVIPLLNDGESPISPLPQEILSLIFSFVYREDPDSLSNAYKVSHLWSLLVTDRLKHIFRTEAFGNAQWKEVGGGDIVKDEDMDEEALSLSTFIDDITQNTSKALFMLHVGRIVRMPEKLSLENVGTVFGLCINRTKGGYGQSGYTNFNPPDKQAHAGGSYWLWAPTKIRGSGIDVSTLDRSGAVVYSPKQIKSAELCPHTREAAAFYVAEYICSGTTWRNNLACCLEKNGETGVNYCLGIAYYGMRVLDYTRGNFNITFMSTLRWQPSKPQSPLKESSLDSGLTDLWFSLKI